MDKTMPNRAIQEVGKFAKNTLHGILANIKNFTATAAV
jgi:hypothetical protein